MNSRFTFILSFVLISWATQVHAQDDSFIDPREPSNGLGGQVLLTNSGFALGGYYTRALGRDVSFIAELSIGSGKDEREVAFIDRFGRRDLPNKANYLLMMPVQIGVEKRLFRSKIEDNFRPFLHLTVGPTIGWLYPYFRDDNGNGMLDSGEKTYDGFSALPKGGFEMGVGGTFALGAYFGATTGIVQSVRIGYTFTHFLDKISLLEPNIRKPGHFFGTPVILVSFGKLF